MPPRSKPVPPIVLRTQALAQAVDSWAKANPDSDEAAEYMDMAQYWYASLASLLGASAAAAASNGVKTK